MSLNTLLESANPYHSLQSDAAKLANKWEKTGLLEGLEDVNRNNMSMILENQAKQLVVESSQTGGGVASQGNFTAGIGGQWAGVALPLVRKVFGQIASKEFVSVQPMNLPSGLVFFLDFLYGTEKTPFTNGQSVYGNTGSVDFETTVTGGLYGPGRFTYSINNTESLALTGAAPSVATWKDMNYDSNYSASFGDYRKHTIDFDGQNADFEGVLGFRFASSSGGAAQLTFAENLPQFNSASANRYVSFIALATDLPGGANAARAGVTASFQLQPTDQYRGDFEDGNLGLNNNNNPISIPEVNVQMKSLAIVAKTRKLKAVWTPEFAQDLNAYHALDAEAELTSILSEYISLEIDLEILSMLIESAASTEVWSAKNNESLSGATTSDLGFYNSQGQWFQTLGTKIQKLSNIIHQKTLRGGANFLVCSPIVGTILESIPGFAADSDGDAAKATYAFGVQKVGSLNGRYKVYKNPYMTTNQMLVGFRGSQFLECGAVFAPYIPLIMTPLVYDPSTFTPRKGLLTRYAKKIVRPEFYGVIDIAGLNTL
jgi:hypothetical protein|tara:strand:+ start:1010 stop:2638 length:1629 start_codon:yes stop_codon:yes gene_type:complete